MLPFIDHCNSLIEQRSAEITAKLMYAWVNELPGMGARGRHVNYNAQYNTGASRGRRDMRKEICRAYGQIGHWARECQNNPNGPAYGSNRPAWETRPPR